MNKYRLMEIFESLIEEWERAEETVIHERSIRPEEDYQELEERIQEYKQKFLEALNDAE